MELGEVFNYRQNNTEILQHICSADSMEIRIGSIDTGTEKMKFDHQVSFPLFLTIACQSAIADTVDPDEAIEMMIGAGFCKADYALLEDLFAKLSKCCSELNESFRSPADLEQ